MTLEERKFCNMLHYAVKGFLIDESYSDEDVKRIGDSYFKRLWGNNERLEYCREPFEKEWAKRQNNC